MTYDKNRHGYYWYKKINQNLPTIYSALPTGWKFIENGGLIFHGSITSGINDRYTDLDLWLILPPYTYSDFVASNPRFYDFEIDKKWGHINIENFDSFKNRVTNCDLPLLYELRNSYFIRGSKGLLNFYESTQRQLSKELVENHFLYNYVLARNWQKSLENVLRRGDKVALMLTISRFIEHTLKAAIVITGKPYPYQKWLYYAASQLGTCDSIVKEVNLLIKLIEKDGFLGHGDNIDNNILFSTLENIKIKLKYLATKNAIDSPVIEKWYLYIEDIDSLIKGKKFNLKDL